SQSATIAPTGPPRPAAVQRSANAFVSVLTRSHPRDRVEDGLRVEVPARVRGRGRPAAQRTGRRLARAPAGPAPVARLGLFDTRGDQRVEILFVFVQSRERGRLSDA